MPFPITRVMKRGTDVALLISEVCFWQPYWLDFSFDSEKPCRKIQAFFLFNLMSFSHLIILNDRALLQTIFGLPGEMNVHERAPKSLHFLKLGKAVHIHSMNAEPWHRALILNLKKKRRRNKSLITRDLTLSVSPGTWLHMSPAHSVRNMKADYRGRHMRRKSIKTAIRCCSKEQLDI